jgi:hypothetical protein
MLGFIRGGILLLAALLGLATTARGQEAPASPAAPIP